MTFVCENSRSVLMSLTIGKMIGKFSWKGKLCT